MKFLFSHPNFVPLRAIAKNTDMKTRIALLLTLLFSTSQGMWAQLSSDTVYVPIDQLPNAGYYLPAPPDTASMDYIDDILQWQWGKSQRPLARGRQANIESMWLPRTMESVIAQVLELDTISAEATPAMDRLLRRSYNTGNFSTVAAKKKYMRKRPFMQMAEDTWAKYDTDYLRTNGSYPSGHTAFGWATVLAFAEMWPELQDTLLRRGFEFGENRIITGAHYQSDVNAGYLCAAAGIARAHSNPAFEEDIKEARAEYRRLKGLPADYDPTEKVGLPLGKKFLNAPVDTTSYRYPGEVLRYQRAKAFRMTARGDSAIQNCTMSQDYFYKFFGHAMNIELSKENTPFIAELMRKINKASLESALALKKTTFRKRPFVQLKEPTTFPDGEESHRKTTSYASTHANVAWGMALVLAEVAPECQDEILRLGYHYGYDRLITGYHWAADIEAARLLACAVVARLHADDMFRDLIRQARAEYLAKKNNF